MADSLSKADFNEFRRTALHYKLPLAVGPAAVPGTLIRWLVSPVKDDDLGTKLLDEIRETVPVLF
jgi:hypothetical protein